MGLEKFTSVFGSQWLVGRYLLPELRILGRRRYDVVLDLACGDSPFRELFTEAGRYIRMDLIPRDSNVIEADMRALPLADRSVDLVILAQALSDVPEPMQVLAELSRVLVPGGRVLVFESMFYPEHDLPHDYYRIMPRGLEWLAVDAGFVFEQCTYLGGLFTRAASLWNNQFMGGLGGLGILRPVAAAGTAAGNLLFYAMDRLLLRRRLASDYLAVLRHPAAEQCEEKSEREGAPSCGPCASA